MHRDDRPSPEGEACLRQRPALATAPLTNPHLAPKPDSAADPTVLPARAARLYRVVWRRYEAACLWNLRKAETPDANACEQTARALRANGDLAAWMLADALRDAARGA